MNAAPPRRPARRLALGLVVLLGLLLGVGGLLAYTHAHALRAQARVRLEQLLAGLLQGQVHIDRVAQLSLGGVEAEGVTVLDPAGRRVLRAKRLSLGLDAGALLHGTLHFSHGALQDVELLAIPSPRAQLSLFDALSPPPSDASEPASKPWLTIVFDHIHVLRGHLTGDVPGLANLEVQQLEARGRIAVDDKLHVRVTTARGLVVQPYERPMQLEHATLTLDSDPIRIDAHARVSQQDDHVRVALRYDAQPDGADALDLQLELAPVSSNMLTNLGVGAALVLVPNMRGYARLTGPTHSLSLRAALQSAAGAVSLRGAFSDQSGFDLRVSSDQLMVHELIAYAPPVVLTLSVHAHAAPGENVQVAISLPKLSIFGVAMSDAWVSGHYQGDRFHFSDARVAYAGGRFLISGWVDNDADLYVRVRSRVPDLARDPSARRTGLSARLETDVQVALAGDALSFEGKVALADFRYEALAADTLVLEGEADFAEGLEQPKLRLHGRGTGVVVAGYPLGELTFRGAGAKGTYDSRVAARGADGRTAALDLRLAQRGQSYRFQASRFELRLPQRAPWRARADVTLTPDGVTITQLELASDAQHLRMAGDFSYSREYRVEASLQKFDLGGLRELSGLDLADLDGIVNGTLALSGVPKHPRIDAHGTLEQGQFLGMRDLQVQLDLVFAAGRFEIDTAVVLPDKSRIAIFTGGEPGPGATWIDQIESGNYQFKLDFQNVPFAVSEPWLAWLNITPPPGTISAKVRGAGTFADPQIDVSSQVRGLVVGPWPKLDIDVALSHDGETLDLRELRIRDELGELVGAQGSISARFAELFAVDALRSSLGQRAFELTLSTPRRRLDELPAPIRIDVPFPALLSARLVQTSAGPTLDLSAVLGFPDQGSGVSSCDGSFRRPEFTLQLSAAQDKARGTLDIELDGERFGGGPLEADLPLTAWLTGAQELAAPRMGFKLDAATVASEDVPVLCEYVAGPISVEASAQDAFAMPPKLHLALRTSALQLSPHPSQRQRLGNLRNAQALGAPFAAEATIDIDDHVISFRGQLEEEDGGVLQFSGKVPGAAFAPAAHQAMAEEPLLLDIDLRARDLELAPLMVALPVPVRTAGQLQGDARFRYDLAQKRVALDGALELRNGAVGIAPLGQQLTDVQARLTMRGNVLRVERLSLRDFDGTASLSGDVTFDSPRDVRAALTVAMADFPIRSEGAQVSRLTGKLAFRAEVGAQEARAELRVQDLRVNLPSDLGLGLQDLEAHPRIVVVGEQPPEPPEAPYVLELRILADNPPFRVLRSDLNAEVRSDLTIRYENPVLSLQGSAQLKRGNFELYGRRFELQESRLSFDRDDHLDPLVSLAATHKIGKDEITVRVEGRLSSPRVSFSHSNPAVTDMGSIVAQLLGVRSTDPTQQHRDASGAAAGILAGATAGLLTERVRRELGGAVPVVSMDSSGRTLRGARIRAGVQLDQLIERRLGRLRKVVRGAYIEGFVAPGAASTQAAIPNAPPQSRGGGLLELRFPADMVGTVEYRPVQNWRVDVAWEP